MRQLLVVATLAACTESSAVTGRFVDHFYTRDGVVERPSDLSTRGFRIFSGGVWYPASGLTEAALDGTIYIPDVPEGPYLLNTVSLGGAMTWEQREERDFVAVANFVGRPDAVPATNAPLRLQIDGLTSWTTGDALVADCFDVGSEQYPLDLQPAPAVGDTRIDITFDWAGNNTGYPPSLMAAGDTLTVSRIQTRLNQGVSTDKLVQIATGPAPVQRDGEPSTFVGTFVDVPETRTAAFSVDVPGFVAQRPNLEQAFGGVALLRGPASSALDLFGTSMVWVGTTDLAPPTAIDVTATFGDPFDPSWQLISYGVFSGRMLLALPDGLPITSAYAHSYELRYVEDNAPIVFAPTPLATSASLNGHALAGDVPWDGVSAFALHIDAPAGIAGFYADVWRVVDGQQEPLTTLRSTSNEITLPSDALTVGHIYVLRVGVEQRTDTAASGSFNWVGPFRLVRP